MTTTTHPALRFMQPPDQDGLTPAHREALAALDTIADRVRYACERGPGPRTEEVRAWLALYGYETKRPYVSTLVTGYRTGRDMADTGDLPALTDDVLADLDAAEPADAFTPREPAPVTTPVTTREPEPAASVETPPAGKSRGTGPFYVVALAATGVSVDTSWRFFGEKLHITQDWERFALFTVLEMALVASGYAMRANVKRPNGTPGPARMLAWVLCGFAAFMALALSGPVEGLARVALGPVLALVALHLALGIEIRVRRGARKGTWARIGAELRERALSRIGLGDDSRTALARTRDRAATRAARLATSKRTPFRRRRLARAVRVSGASLDPVQRERLVTQVAALRHLDDLVKTDRPSPWR